MAWAPILAVILVLCGLKWPAYLDPSFDLIKGANASVAVFAAGITLSSVKIKINGQAIMGSFLKLIIMPLAILVVGIIFRMEPVNLKMLVVCAALPPAFSGIIIAAAGPSGGSPPPPGPRRGRGLPPPLPACPAPAR